MKKDLHIDNVIDFESAKKAYLKKKGISEKKPSQKKVKDDPFDWERIRSIKVVCRDKH